MPEYEDAAKLTIALIDNAHTPDEITDALLERLIHMAADSQVNIWQDGAGLSVEGLATMYRHYGIGGGYDLSRTCSNIMA